VLLVLTVYKAGVVPKRACFDADADGVLWYYELAISLFFLADIAVAFNTAI